MRIADGISSRPRWVGTPSACRGSCEFARSSPSIAQVSACLATSGRRIAPCTCVRCSTSFFEWARATRETAVGNNLATKALGYALNQESELRRVLDDGTIPLDNTRAERALRKISFRVGVAAAAIFSLIASCRLHRLDPFAYLEEVLRVLPYWPRDRYLELAPVHWSVTRDRLDPDELTMQIGSFTVPLLDSATFG